MIALSLSEDTEAGIKVPPFESRFLEFANGLKYNPFFLSEPFALVKALLILLISFLYSFLTAGTS